MKLRFFFEARKDVEKIIGTLIQAKSQVTDEEIFAFARIEYSLGLLDSAESLLKKLIEKDATNQRYRDLSVEIIARRKAMLLCETTSKSKGCCCK